MAKMKLDGYGGKAEFFDSETMKVQAFNDVSGGDGSVDPYGDMEKKEKDSINMNAGEAFNKSDFTKVEAMGTDYPKKKYNQVEERQDGDHFKASTDIDAYGTDCGKKQSFQSRRKGE